MNKIYYYPITNLLYEKRGNQYSVGCHFIDDCRTVIPEANIKNPEADFEKRLIRIDTNYPSRHMDILYWHKFLNNYHSWRVHPNRSQRQEW